MRIGRTTFPETVKDMSWTQFKETYGNSRSVMGELNLKNISLKEAYKILTGKEAKTTTRTFKTPKKSEDVPETEK